LKTSPIAWLICGILAGFLMQLSPPLAEAAQSAGTQFVYFGTYTSQRSKGIYVAEFDPSSGRLTTPQLAAETRNPTFLALDPNRHFLYAVNEVSDIGADGQGAVSAFKVDPQSAKLTVLNQQPSGGAGPCHLAVSANGTCVLVANYVSGSVAVLPIESDGRLLKPSSSIQHHGSSVNHQRQEGPHAHFVTWDPANRLVLACDLGLDKVLIYHLGGAPLSLTANDPPFFTLKPGSGPRHLAFHPNGKIAYIINELSSSLTVCSYDGQRGELKEIQTVSTLPDNFSGANTCAEVAVHPSGRFVYASNRGHDSIAVFWVDPASGIVQCVQHQLIQGKTPRHFAIDPTAKWLLAEAQDSNRVVVFSLNAETGRLAPTEQSQSIGAPVCAVFVPKQ
jgi:6-phosphogluconolactonase